MGNKPGQSRRVAVVYHYFAHYRRPVVFDLISAGKHHYEFLGCDHSFGSGIKIIEDFPEGRFRKTRGWMIGPMLIQPAAVIAAIGTRYDTLILLGDSKWPTTWLAAIIGRARGKRVFFWTHGWLREERGLQRRFRDAFYKIANGLLLYNHRAKDFGVGHGFDKDRLHVIYNSLNTDAQRGVRDTISQEQAQAAREEYFPERADCPILTTVTRLQPDKKIEMLIDAAAELEARGQHVNVLIVGDGPIREQLEERARNAGVSAHFTGAIYDERALGRMFKAADLTIMPGAIGLLVMHSMVYGTPVITHNNFDNQGPESEAIIEGVTGGFFEEGSVESLAAAIEQWIKSPKKLAGGKEQAKDMIDRFYNPQAQVALIDRAVDGKQAEHKDEEFFKGTKPGTAS